MFDFFLRLADLTYAQSNSSAEVIMDEQPVDYIKPLAGTSNSRWMIFPGASMPFGMVKLSPDNQRRGWKAGYEYTIENIAGFSHETEKTSSVYYTVVLEDYNIKVESTSTTEPGSNVTPSPNLIQPVK